MKLTAEDLNKLLISEKVDGSRHRLIAKYKNREPDPGPCIVLMIDWETRRMSISNGACRYYPSFEEVEFVDLH